MTFEQLECFLAAVESDTFLDAADYLHMTQSTLSKQITKLEKELDILLFDRSHRTAFLTKGGEFFYPEAKALIRQYRQTLDRAKDYQKQSSHTLRIGTLPIMPQYRLGTFLKNFEKKYPDIIVYVEEGEEAELLQGLDEGEYDFIFIFACGVMVSEEEYTLYPIAQDQLVAVLPNTHPLASNTSVFVKDLYDESFVLMKPTTSIYRVCMELFKGNDINADISFTGRPETIVAAVLEGEGISLLPNRYFNAFFRDTLITVPIEPAAPVKVVAARKNKIKAAESVRAFTDYLS